MKDHTRIDVFANMAEAMDFIDWARSQGCKPGESMAPYLARYKKPDLTVKAFKEHVEHQLTQEMKKKETPEC